LQLTSLSPQHLNFVMYSCFSDNRTVGNDTKFCWSGWHLVEGWLFRQRSDV
jgi:hypothetical protein